VPPRFLPLPCRRTGSAYRFWRVQTLLHTAH
jgi:hypothetical protein